MAAPAVEVERRGELSGGGEGVLVVECEGWGCCECKSCHVLLCLWVSRVAFVRRGKVCGG